MIAIASLSLGAVMGLICVAIFAVILRRISQKNPSEALKALWKLSSFALGGWGADYVLFDRILSAGGAWQYYLLGFAIVFLPLGVWVFVDWSR